MEVLQSWRFRFSFRSATIVICFFNVVAALLLLRSFFSAASFRFVPYKETHTVDLRYIQESEEIRRSFEPVELIKRVREIQKETHVKQEDVLNNDTKHASALDISRKMKTLRSLNDAASLKALEEWRKRKMERARQRRQEKS